MLCYLSAKTVFLSTVMYYGVLCTTLWVNRGSGTHLELSAEVALVLPSYSEECFEILIQKECFYDLVLNSQMRIFQNLPTFGTLSDLLKG